MQWSLLTLISLIPMPNKVNWGWAVKRMVKEDAITINSKIMVILRQDIIYEVFACEMN